LKVTRQTMTVASKKANDNLGVGPRREKGGSPVEKWAMVDEKGGG